MNTIAGMKRLLRNDRGAIMLEALIVYGVTLILLFMILAIFSVLYQRWNLQTIANETAARVAQTYRYSAIDESSGYVDVNQYTAAKPYRYVGDKLENSAESRIKSYAFDRLSRTTFTNDATDPICEVTIEGDSMGRRHAAVVLTGEYSVPFGAALDYFGFDGTIKYEVKAYSECMDIVDYIGFVDFIDVQTDLKLFSSSTISFLNSIIKLFDEIFYE